jgi:hypothetical protein
VLTAPVFVAVTFDGDTLRKDLESFTAAIGASTYWKAIGSEYGVGAGKGGTPVHLTTAAAAQLTSQQIQDWLTSQLDGTHPEWGTPDTNTHYAIYYPEGTTIQLDQWGTSCKGFGGYHGQVTIPGGKAATYSVLPRCGGSYGYTMLDMLTNAASHEFIESATDPFSETNPAFMMPDDAHAIWMLMPLSEVGDMCTYRTGVSIRPPDLPYLVQRTWSNAAAKADKDPCVPGVDAPYFNSAPVLDEDVHVDLGMGPQSTKGVKIPVGQEKTVEVVLFSDKATSGPWSVRAIESSGYSSTLTGPTNPTLSFTWDRTQGVNGEKLHLTIKSLRPGDYGGSEFIILSSLGRTLNSWMGFVQN